jgi:hypothetical protein
MSEERQDAARRRVLTAEDHRGLGGYSTPWTATIRRRAAPSRRRLAAW